ncbi:hypothetical protein FH972_001626 [Carpinus fangiana]|uniref:Photolyase/cryptochrome alpha/beta domain-containing protein n=1 Tax=Carpinus fangiana TaxID=176857 RepID=A0A5N6QFL7_9ROSI|nr:hypothetical protein FH972_001626 [Carpinus fangiana]
MAKHGRTTSQDGDLPKSKQARSSEPGSKTNGLKHPTVARAKQIDADPPFFQLEELLNRSSNDVEPRNVLHWFRSKDLRMQDNHALSEASKKAKEVSGSLLTVYMFTPADMEWHGTSPARTDFILQSLKLLKGELAEKNIPLAIVTAKERKQKTDTILDFVDRHHVSHVYANYEYEIDELRRDIKVAHGLHDKDVALSILHDQTVITPGELIGGGGGPLKVYTPYHKAWCATVKAKPTLLDTYPDPSSNDASCKTAFKDLFASKVPQLSDAPSSKQFDSAEHRDRIRKLWPAGHAAGVDRLNKFLKSKVRSYGETRSNPGADSSSRMSPYFSAGLVSPREACSACLAHNRSAKADFISSSADIGVSAWVREIVFREFYRHTLIGKPSDSMNMPHNLKFDYVQWETNEDHWQAWCDGQTGMPLVDAGMRQLKAEAWMHNRARMNTASYLRTNLLIDYRRGERWFAQNLIDWDLANNTQGWEPSYTVFNPVSQAERNDPDAEYIKRWVPELKNLQGKEIFDPSARMSAKEFAKLEYPKPIVDWKKTKAIALETYKRDLHSHDGDEDEAGDASE